MSRLPDRLLLITDRKLASRPLEQVVAAALAGGCRWVSLRERDLPPSERRRLLVRLLERAASCGACIGVHADLEAAADLRLPALHLPAGADVAAARARLGPKPVIGISTHDPAEIAAAGAAGADYVTFGPVLPSLSKPGHGDSGGLARLGAATAAAGLPVLALGGITAATAAACRALGAAGVAVVGAVMQADDPAAATRAILHALKEGQDVGPALAAANRRDSTTPVERQGFSKG
ncbi:thiamine phosphate synthase [Benzoatithermus flavus]|uniref:Thiamine phosphate synthase n=1 Tax=Benzoatithermus flavus TaxID=3108223 RepID=A0ABU8XQQ7_9PROT